MLRHDNGDWIIQGMDSGGGLGGMEGSDTRFRYFTIFPIGRLSLKVADHKRRIFPCSFVSLFTGA